jgi:putative heme-binding domain-containing protein
VFFSPKIGTCASCHEIDGRGNRVGPQLSGIGRDSTRRSLLRAILQPNENISPAHRLWQVETRDGEVRLGMALRKGGRREIYRDATGNTFRVTKEELVSTRELNRSLMPPDLPRNMTAAELRDLLAYLMQRR